jgi:hypothetical protein
MTRWCPKRECGHQLVQRADGHLYCTRYECWHGVIPVPPALAALTEEGR